MNRTRPLRPSEDAGHGLNSPGWHAARVAVVDSGWNRNFFNVRVSRGANFVPHGAPGSARDGDDDHDRIGHGTACARLVLTAARSAIVVPLRVFDRTLETSIPVVCAALEWALAAKIDVVTLSLATLRHDARHPLSSVCRRLHSIGTTVIAAADGTAGLGYPAALPKVVAVDIQNQDHAQRRRQLPDAITVRAGIHNFAAMKTIRIESTSSATAFVAGCAADLLRRRGCVSVLRADIHSRFPGLLID